MSLSRQWQKLDRWLSQVAVTGFLKPRNLHYACALSGPIAGGFFISCFIASGFLPPMRPWWSAERSLEHYQAHLTGMHVGSALMMFAGAFFIPFYCVVADQMQRMPNMPWILPQLQLASGTASTIGFFLPGMQLAVAAFRRDREPALLELANDSFWIFAIMPFSSFFPLCWSWAYAILLDTREKPLYPKYMAIGNFIVPFMFLWSAAIHATHSGPFAWNGGFGFWTPLGVFGLLFVGDTYFLLKAIQKDFAEEDTSGILCNSIRSEAPKNEP
ncbi:uncharacterized protein E0L32_002268 [Thyridium curvatum]|uniref:Uncharacterized protein n=1 Tax=Thyridium curvatum TaxID=1093900 RepID=A0A507AEH6_9PEZI|nr:uncharacterized protein E0L32_002268 [Thyridium curvatum]TPX06772.1 hypothetical protein E0L32_002268 [Thyridium curvatum]